MIQLPGVNPQAVEEDDTLSHNVNASTNFLIVNGQVNAEKFKSSD